MGVVINTNIMSLNAQRNLTVNQNKLSISVQRLSSGLRINSAKDDAAGLAISAKISAQVVSIQVAIRNAQDGISLAQVAEGGLAEIGNILTRMRELAEEAANGTLGTSERSALNNEYQQLKSEINRIASVTEFNGTKLLDGTKSTSGVTLQVGYMSTSADTINFFSGVAATDVTNLGITGAASVILSAVNAQSALIKIDSAIAIVAERRGTLGAIQNRLEHTINNLRIASENLSAANSRIKDADFAYETAIFTRNQILVQAGTAVLAQANVLPQNALQLLR